MYPHHKVDSSPWTTCQICCKGWLCNSGKQWQLRNHGYINEYIQNQGGHKYPKSGWAKHWPSRDKWKELAELEKEIKKVSLYQSKCNLTKHVQGKQKINSEPAGRSSIGYTRDFFLYYGPDIIHHIPIQNQRRRPQNYPACQPSGAAILNARNHYWCRKRL